MSRRRARVPISPIPMYFSGLTLENVRCFGAKQELDLTLEDDRPARWTLILGENGVGKTTLLQCLAWMRLVPDGAAPITADADDPDAPFIRGKLGPALSTEENETLEGLLRAHAPNNKLGISVRLDFGQTLPPSSVGNVRSRSRLKLDYEIAFNEQRGLKEARRIRPKVLTIQRNLHGEFYEPLVVAYGASRQLGFQNLADEALKDPIAARLSGPTELYDAEEMLSLLDYRAAKREQSSTGRGRRGQTDNRDREELERLQQAIMRILPEGLGSGDIIIQAPDIPGRSREQGGIHFKTFSGLVPLSALSLGYQSTLAWTLDLAWRMMLRYPKSPNPLEEPAVVLIDEIDLHLHPLWQLEIIDKLTEVFPNTQFIATAHSPLMVQVAETAKIVLLRKRGSSVEIDSRPDVVKSWRVDQILMSELFNVPRARNKATTRLFDRRDELLDKPDRGPAEDKELEVIRAKIAALPTAQDPKDQAAMDFIREAAALLKERKQIDDQDLEAKDRSRRAKKARRGSTKQGLRRL